MNDKAPGPVCSQGSALRAGEWRSSTECERSCLTSPWRPPERRQADRRQGSDEWVTSPRWRLPVCSGLFGQSGRRRRRRRGGEKNRAMRSECAHQAEHTLQEHVKESVKLLRTLSFVQSGEAGERSSVLRGKKCKKTFS